MKVSDANVTLSNRDAGELLPYAQWYNTSRNMRLLFWLGFIVELPYDYSM